MKDRRSGEGEKGKKGRSGEARREEREKSYLPSKFNNVTYLYNKIELVKRG
jgi:hypothetical protein